MTTTPTVKTPPYKPTTPHHSLFPNHISPWTTPCHFTLPTFLHVLKDLTLHPERNSSLILRADPIPLDTQSQIKSTVHEDEDESFEFEEWVKREGMELVEEIGVRLMPKQPKRDGKLDQRVLFYRSKESVNGHQEEGSRVEKGIVVMIPMVKEIEEIPFFHPPVKRLVFYYESHTRTVEEEIVQGMNDLSTTDPDPTLESTTGESVEVDDSPDVLGLISISYLPFPSALSLASPLNPTPSSSSSNLSPSPSNPQPAVSENPMLGSRRTSLPRKRSPLAGPDPTPTELIKGKEKEDPTVTQARLYRTCLALLERVYKHGFGQMVGYKKRVNHDVCPSFLPIFQEIKSANIIDGS